MLQGRSKNVTPTGNNSKKLFQREWCVTWKESWVTTFSGARRNLANPPDADLNPLTPLPPATIHWESGKVWYLKIHWLIFFRRLWGAETESFAFFFLSSIFFFAHNRDRCAQWNKLWCRASERARRTCVWVNERTGRALFHSARHYLLVIHLTTWAIFNCLINALLCSVKKANLFYCPAAAW